MGGRKGRDGLFPATSCIKIAGYFGEKKSWDFGWTWFEFLIQFPDDNKETITVRGCALDSGTLTTDTEIIRMSHCGKFYYEDRWGWSWGVTWNFLNFSRFQVRSRLSAVMRRFRWMQRSKHTDDDQHAHNSKHHNPRIDLKGPPKELTTSQQFFTRILREKFRWKQKTLFDVIQCTRILSFYTKKTGMVSREDARACWLRPCSRSKGVAVISSAAAAFHNASENFFI